MRDVAAKRKGIILFHDIHASTARALPRILEELRSRGFRVVHLVPAAGAETLPEYDALARERAESKRVAAVNPLSRRVAWPSRVLSEAKAAAKPPAPGPHHPPAPRTDKDWSVGIWHQ
jgi:hypothetical protein